MQNFNLVIAAAGKGQRSGLNYPKTLYKVNGKPILINIIHSFLKTKIKFNKVTIIVSPKGKYPITECLKKYNLLNICEILIQYIQLGMGNSIIQLSKSNYINNTSNIFLIWGDIVSPQITTIKKLVNLYIKNFNHFSFATKFVSNPYTLVVRDKKNALIKVEEIKNKKTIEYGERDIGMFVFKFHSIIQLLNSYKIKNNINLEHSFLKVIETLIKKKYSVEGYSIATNKDLISLNTISDIKESQL